MTRFFHKAITIVGKLIVSLPFTPEILSTMTNVKRRAAHMPSQFPSRNRYHKEPLHQHLFARKLVPQPTLLLLAGNPLEVAEKELYF